MKELNDLFSGYFLLIEGFKELFVSIGKSIKGQILLDSDLEFLFDFWQFINGLIDFIENGWLKMFKRNDFGFDCVYDALNWKMWAFIVLFVALTGYVPTKERNYIASFAATYESGWIFQRASSGEWFRNGEGSFIKTLNMILVFHGCKDSWIYIIISQMSWGYIKFRYYLFNQSLAIIILVIFLNLPKVDFRTLTYSTRLSTELIKISQA